MSIIVVGAGAIGQLVAGQLARAGQPVVLLGRGQNIAGLQQHGLQLRLKHETIVVPELRVSGRAEELVAEGRPALVILAVKAYDTPAALATLDILRPLTVLTLQNGIGNEEFLARHLGAERILAGAITSSVTVDAPGVITVTKAGGVGLAQVGPHTPLATWSATFRAAGFTTREYADYRALKWSKALLNMLGNASSAILDMPPAESYKHRGVVALERQAQLEALAVMECEGMQPVNLPSYPAAGLAWAVRSLPLPLLQPLLRKLVGGGRGGKMPSLHGDLARGRKRSEGAQLYGAVVHEAGRLGLAAPANQKLWGTLQRIINGEVAWDVYRGKPLAFTQVL